MYEEGRKEAEAKAINYEPLLSAGLCDNCSVPKMVNSGDGVNEPFDPVLWCDKKSIIIEPMPKDGQIGECECFHPCTLTSRL